jgi:RNA polymerase sigma-70 factor (ECF subfamily)
MTARSPPDTAFEAARPRLFALAYRMLGGVADAEDLVQEVYLRWRRAARADVASPEAWLRRAATRLAIDRLRTLKAQRAAYDGLWLPEPVADMPSDRLEETETLSFAFLLMLERLAPIERAVLVLREAFDHDHAEIARATGRGVAACRQILHRARARLREPGEGPPVPTAASASSKRGRAAAAGIARRFRAHCAAGDLAAAVALLAPGAVAISDGGGKVKTARRPILGAERVARLMIGLGRKAGRRLDDHPASINGMPGIIGARDGRPARATLFAIARGRIAAVFIQANPDKLRGVGAPRPGSGR